MGQHEHAQFHTTHWSVVLAAADQNVPAAREALSALCGTYREPLFCFARRLGDSPEDADDLVQAFFAELLDKHYVRQADRGRGKFRTFLLSAFKNFRSKQREKANAEKRGGGRKTFSQDIEDEERKFSSLAPDTLTPEAIFDRRCAHALLGKVLGRLREEYTRKGKEALYEHLKSHLQQDEDALSYGEAAMQLGMTENAVKQESSRLRRRLRELLDAEIATTVGPDADDIDEEKNTLLKAFRSTK